MVGDMSILCSIILSASPIVYNWNLVFHLILKNGIDTECKEMLQNLAEEYKFRV